MSRTLLTLVVLSASLPCLAQTSTAAAAATKTTPPSSYADEALVVADHLSAGEGGPGDGWGFVVRGVVVFFGGGRAELRSGPAADVLVAGI